MDTGTRALIEAIHRAPLKCVLALTGGGTGAAADLLGVPGASRTVLEVVVPYAEAALTEFLGRRPEQFCSAATSQDLAGRARARATWVAPGEAVAGLGCTAALATDRPKRGDHRFFVTVQHGDGSTTYSLTLKKGARDRAGEEKVLDAVLLNALAEACGIGERMPPALLAGEQVEVTTGGGTGLLGPLFQGAVSALCVEADGRVIAHRQPPPVVIPGAFNPLHAGHCSLAAVAGQIVRGEAAFELSVTNVDKPPLSPEETRRRLAQFSWKAPVWLTRAPTFREKAALFLGSVFVVGTDTAARIVAPRYYGNSTEARDAALKEIRDRGCRFLVAGRMDEAGKFQGLEGVTLPTAFRDLFTAIPETAFRVDISSTQLRAEMQPARSI
jgi:hypothetical protein